MHFVDVTYSQKGLKIIDKDFVIHSKNNILRHINP